MRSALSCVTLFCLVACGSPSTDVAATVADADPTATTVLAAETSTSEVAMTPVALSPGSQSVSIEVDGVERRFGLYVPAAVDVGEPLPLIVSLHGLTETATVQESRGLNDLAETEHFVVAYPNALYGSWRFVAGADVDFVSALIDRVADELAIDLDRVYAIGHSQGASFTGFLACHLGDRISAVAQVASMHHFDPPVCPTPVATPLLTILGETDNIYSIEEGLTLNVADRDKPGPLEVETAAWAETNACELEPVEESLGEGNKLVRRWDYPCDLGDLVVYVHSFGHIWPIHVHGVEANDVIWEFLQKHPTPPTSG